MKNLTDISELVKNCTNCELSLTRINAVPGEGFFQSKIMLIGEAPGYYEDNSGKPFVGAAGKLLTKLLNSINLSREDVFITNIVKCRPPNNRDPSPNEINKCSPYLSKQIELINPTLIITLGRHSLSYFVPKIPIGKAHGTIINQTGYTIYPTYHPAAALRQTRFHEILSEEFKRIPSLIKSLETKTDKPESVNDQLQLF